MGLNTAEVSAKDIIEAESHNKFNEESELDFFKLVQVTSRRAWMLTAVTASMNKTVES